MLTKIRNYALGALLLVSVIFGLAGPILYPELLADTSASGEYGYIYPTPLL